MKMIFSLVASVTGLVLYTGTVALQADPADAQPRSANREEIRRLLRELPPEERRALIRELRDQPAGQPDKPRPDAPPPSVNREEISRQLRDLPPEERRARIEELRGQPSARPEPPRGEDRRTAPRENQPGNRPPLAAPQGGPTGRFAPMFERVMNEDQRASFREAMESQRDNLRELDEKLRGARREALQAGVGEKFEEKAVRRKAMAVAELEAEMTVIRARALAQVKPPLSAEQIERLRNPPPFEGGSPRPEFRGDESPRSGRRGPPRSGDENDFPPRPRPEQ